MEADHSRMRKFTGPNDPLYIKVSKCIQRLAEAAPDAIGIKFNVGNITGLSKPKTPLCQPNLSLLPDFQISRVAEILPQIRLVFVN
jgi:hypothetical protein